MQTPPRRWPKVLVIVAAVVVVVLAGAVLVLDRVLLSVAREQAAKLSQELKRPIALGGVATKLWGGLGVKVTGVSVGPGPGESVKLLELGRAEVTASLLRALLSGGKEIQIHEAVIQGLRVNVEKLSDGTTNLERLSRQLEARSAGQPLRSAEPAQARPARKPGEPPELEVGRAALLDARLSLLDRTVPGAKELFVDHLDAEVRDLRVGKPLELVVKAAVLAEQQNLELRVRAAPLPASLVPTPEQVTLKVQPIDLAPLAPFLPRAVGLQGGRFQADLQAVLGAAVPGGHGPATLQGGFQASQLAFAGQAGGKRLDASLSADLSADAGAGDLTIRKLDLVAGPASLTGQGKVTGLTGNSPKVEGLEITSRGLDPAALTEYYPPLRKQMGGAVVAGPVGLSVQGHGTAAAQRVELKVDLTPVRLEVPHELDKAAGAPMVLTAALDAAQGGGQLRLEADADLAGVDLRPGGSLNKKPGDPLSVKLAGTYRKTGDELQAALTRLDLNLLGDALSGKGQVTLAGAGRSRTTRFDAELGGDRLDLDRLLVSGPAEKKPKAAPAGAGTGGTAPASPLAGVSGEARLRLGALKVKGVEARQVLARVEVKDETVTLQQAQLSAFGGSIDAAGTTVRLSPGNEPFHVLGKLRGVEAEQALKLVSSRDLLSGSLDLDLNLSGPGLDSAVLTKAVSGTIQGELRDGVFHGMDLVGAVAGPLAGKLPLAKKLIEAKGGGTSLGKELPFAFKIADGVAQLTHPLSFDAGQGKADLSGGIGLDGSLHMPATVALSPDFLSRLTGGKVKPTGPVPLTFQLGGKASSPSVQGLSVDAAAKTLLAGAATSALGKALGLGGGSGDAGSKGGEDTKKQLQDEAAKKLKKLFQ